MQSPPRPTPDARQHRTPIPTASLGLGDEWRIAALGAALWLALLLLLSGPARAGDLDLLAGGGGVPPNVVILVDTSGSMRNIVWDDGYLSSKLYAETCWNQHTISGSSCPGFGNPGDLCPNNEVRVEIGESDAPSINVKCDGTTRTLYVDPEVSDTWYALNYLNYLYGVATPADLVDQPTQSRMTAAKEVLSDLIKEINPDDGGGYVENVRFGLARLREREAGCVFAPIAPNNKAKLLDELAKLSADGSTPVSEALLDVARYFAGDDALSGYPKYDMDPKKCDKKKSSTKKAPPSPIDNACRQNFVIVISDGVPSYDLHPCPGQQDDAAKPPCQRFVDLIGNADQDGNECSTDFPDTCIDAPKTGRDDGRVYGVTGGSDWLDDVAHFLYSHDFDPNLGGTQNLITYTVGFSLDHPLLLETAQNGNGRYFTTQEADQLRDDLKAAIDEIIERSYSFSSVAVPAGRTPFGDGLYSAWFLPSARDPFWEGHLEAFRLTPTGAVLDQNGDLAVNPGTGQFEESRVPFWDAGEELQSNTSRALYTTSAGAQIDFTPATVTPPMLGIAPSEITLYPNYPASGVNTLPRLRDALVDYLHGRDAFDEDDDGDSTELRETVLGDIFHSSPVAVARPSTGLLQEEGFGVVSSGQSFFERYSVRDRVVYAGANDGMLHAFDGGALQTGDNPLTSEVEDGYYDMGTGGERFGYVPGFLLDQIKFLPRNVPRTYYYVDGSPIVADAWLGDPGDPDDLTRDASEWATVLVVGAREGADGYLALDVTDPDATSTDPHGPYPVLLWEFTGARLGEAWSEPVITRVKVEGPTGSGDQCGPDNGDGDCREEWVAIFAGGYADTGNPNDPAFDAASLAGKALYVVELDSGDVLARVEYDPLGVSGPAAMRYAIPSSPAVLDLDFDGYSDVVYVGDLGGQVWKWDLSGVGADSDADGEIDSWTAGIFFQSPVEDMGGGVLHYRSLFFSPSAAFSKGSLVLAFASGEREDVDYAGDAAKDENNRLYVIHDPVPTGAGAFSAVYGESDLTNITGLDRDTNPTDLGFYLVARDGEKFVTPGTIFGGSFITASFVPEASATTCGGVSGESFLYVLDLESGQGFFFESGVTTGDDARRISVGSGVPTAPKLVTSAKGHQIYLKTSGGELFQMQPPSPSATIELIYWRTKS